MNKIISFVMVGTNDLEKSSKFYDAIFVHLGLKKVSTSERMIAMLIQMILMKLSFT